jgi:hypothetical protein
MAFDPISLALEIGGKVLDRVFPDPTERAKAQLELLKLEQSGDLAVMTAQTDINKVEAGNAHLFVSGWRPFVGWCCGIALLYASLIEPFSRFIAQVVFKYNGEFPYIDTDLTLQILLGLLGLAGMRSWEKKEGVASK